MTRILRANTCTNVSGVSATDRTIAQCLYAGITDPQVTTTANFTGYDSPLLEALTTPKMKALVRGGFAILQIGFGVAAMTASPATGGVSAVPGAYSVLRGLDELFGSASDYVNNNQIGQRSFTALAVDQGTGNQTTTDRILMVADIGMGIWDVRRVPVPGKPHRAVMPSGEGGRVWRLCARPGPRGQGREWIRRTRQNRSLNWMPRDLCSARVLCSARILVRRRSPDLAAISSRSPDRRALFTATSSNENRSGDRTPKPARSGDLRRTMFHNAALMIIPPPIRKHQSVIPQHLV